jgi:AcrR family transcriptional regulator
MIIDTNSVLVCTTVDMKTTRTYTMTARAQAVEDTKARIREALFELAMTRVFPDISLDDVAAEAGVSVQTVLRHYGSRSALIEATMEYAIDRVTAERVVPEGDVDTALAVLVDHYELRGDTVLLLLAQEAGDEQVHRLTENGRRMHREWVRTTFATVAAGHEDVVDLLVVATDVYTWKLLRRDRGHSRATTEERMKDLVHAVIRDAERSD